jgi:hypothetical protein
MRCVHRESPERASFRRLIQHPGRGLPTAHAMSRAKASRQSGAMSTDRIEEDSRRGAVATSTG